MDDKYESRKKEGEIIRTIFNNLWWEALKINNNMLSYADIVRIRDILRSDAPKYIGRISLPSTIDAGLVFSIAILDPNKARMKENFKKTISLAGTTTGIWLIYSALAQILNPALWASIAAFFAGGSATGPLAPLTISGGIAMICASVYIALQKKTPEERNAACHKCVMKAIDKWIKHGTNDDETNRAPAIPLPQGAYKLNNEQTSINLNSSTQREYC